MPAPDRQQTYEQMPAAVDQPKHRLPVRFRLLCVGSEEPSWINLTLQLDREGCLDPQFRWVSAAGETLALLRDESFDCIVICETGTAASVDDPEALLRAIPASGCDDPIVFIAAKVDDRRWARLCQYDCEFLISPSRWDSPALLPVIKRAVSRIETLRDNRRMAVSNQRRLHRERDEAGRLLDQQRQILGELQRSAAPPRVPVAARFQDQSGMRRQRDDRTSAVAANLPDELNGYYHELLRTYVIMGSGNLGKEMSRLAELLAVAGLTPREALQLHLEQVENLVSGLGNRSSRHVMARADLLALELMIHLGERYQQASQNTQ